MGKTNIQYNTDWEKDYDFLAPVIDVHKAQSKKCNCICSIKSGGRADIKRHTIRNIENCVQKQIVMILSKINWTTLLMNWIRITKFLHFCIIYLFCNIFQNI